MTYALEEGDHSSWTPLVTFYVAARLKNAVAQAATGFALPMVKSILVLAAVSMALPVFLWIASIYVSMPVRLALVFPALVFDVYDKSVIFVMFFFAKRYETSSLGRKMSKLFEFYPAINIEHRVERTNAFVSLVLGYSVVGVMFQSHSSVVFDAFLGKAILGLIQAFLFNWIYFDIDANNIHVHAIRRSAVSGKCTVETGGIAFPC
jgi:low temperature requirement protein LtrA